MTAIHSRSGTTESPMDDGSGGRSQEPLVSRTFFGFVGTQFLGAFNDNYFKQMVLLACIAQIAVDKSDRQPLAMAAFALPFVMLSGFGGYLSDRWSRQRIIVWCKVAEIAVMGTALAVLLIPDITASTQLLLLIGVLALMGAQSAIFGPSKYGILPELFRPEQLVLANGIIQMTTFLAIIFGLGCAGYAMDSLQRSLWLGSLIAVAIAVAGTLTSLFIRRTEAAEPNLQLKWENLAVPREIRSLLRARPELLKSLLVASVFWFIGGVVQPTVNVLGKEVMRLSDTRTSLLMVGVGVGIAAGCVLVGVVARNGGTVWVMRGAWGITASLLMTGALGSLAKPGSVSAEFQESLWSYLFTASPLEWGLRISMTCLGITSGVFIVPIQTYLQQSPPADQKGRVIGVLNLFNWIGILLSAGFLALTNLSLSLLFESSVAIRQQYMIFLILSAMMLPVAIWYRIADSAEGTEESSADASPNPGPLGT